MTPLNNWNTSNTPFFNNCYDDKYGKKILAKFVKQLTGKSSELQNIKKISNPMSLLYIGNNQ